MTQKEFDSINWHRGNVVRLENGKEYLVKGTKGHGKYLLLYSEEYGKSFVADYMIVDSRTSDYEEPVEVYLEMKRQKRAEAEARREAERQERLRAKAERRQRNLAEQERIHREAMERKAAVKALRQKAKEAKNEIEKLAEPEVKHAAKAESKIITKSESKPIAKTDSKPTVADVSEAPKKRVRQRIRIATSRVEKVKI